MYLSEMLRSITILSKYAYISLKLILILNVPASTYNTSTQHVGALFNQNHAYRFFFF